MSLANRYDVVIAGGGLAGLCLALQLRRKHPRIEVLVAEKDELPPPRAAHKVGESAVEVASHYFGKVLGLTDLLAEELPKFGLRFFMSNGDNKDVASRLECGPSHFLTVPSHHLDRGKFEAALALENRKAGVTLEAECTVKDVELGRGHGDHRVSIELDGTEHQVQCRWFIDGSGRSALLKRQLDLAQPTRHKVNAVWFRVDHPIDIDDWSDDIHWGSRIKHSRRLSTNHLVGKGYWLWLIPLVGGQTSVGIVAADRLHPFSGLSSLKKVLGWLDRHEPQCAEVVRRHADNMMDFKALRDFSYNVKQVFSGDRWCLLGDAGLFVDPLYSPGNDFIAISNGYVTDLVVRDLRGQDIGDLAQRYDQAYRSLARSYLVNFYRQYPLFGCARVMTTKIVWDFVMYWGGIALLFFSDRFCDETFMERMRPTMKEFASINVRVQALFRNWASAPEVMDPRPGSFVDYAELGFLAALNAELLHTDDDDDALHARIEANLSLARDLHLEIVAEAAGSLPAIAGQGWGTPRTNHLDEMFATLRSSS